MLSLVNLSKSFGNKVLFKDLSHSLPEGQRIGLVGANGAGKTSLLNIICGLDKCDGKGTVVKPQNSRLGYLPQEINPDPKDTILNECLSGHSTLWHLYHEREKLLQEMGTNYSEDTHLKYEKAEELFQNNGGYQLEGEACRLLKGLGFNEKDLSRDPHELSGGWRMRLELAKILLNKPDILVLDEPTNHLDLPSLMFLENYLLTFPGTLLFVSHDQDLLDRLAKKILYLRSGKITEYSGNFSFFLEQNALEQDQALAKKQGIDKQIEHAQSFVDRFGAKSSKAKQANSRKKFISRMQALQSTLDFEEPKAFPHIAMSIQKPSAKKVLTIENCEVGYDKPLIKRLNLQVQKGQKLAIIGANGIGKSTIIKTLVDEIPLLNGSITWGENVTLAYYAQSQVDQLDMTKTAFQNVLETNSQLSDNIIRKILGSMMFKEVDAYKNVSVMSGGEKSRVGLACLIAKYANVLLMDEPTNHLDMIAMEKLADALSDYEGTVLFVSHDRRFINRVATHVLGINYEGKSFFNEGNLDEFFEEANRLGFILMPEKD